MKITRCMSLLLLTVIAASCEPESKPESQENGSQYETEEFHKAVVRVGIMGDSISTFSGWLCNSDYKYHYPCEEDDVLSVEQTWWWKLIYEKMENGVLDVNNSCSGTKVSHGRYQGVSGTYHDAGFVDRVEDFFAPDVIIIHGGTNDCIKDTDKENIGEYQWDTPLDEMDLTKFRSAYVYLVRKLQELYDGVRLILIVGDRLGADADLKYDDTIIEIAKHFGLPYVDLTPHRKVDIPVPDNCHPNHVGHAFIAQKIYDTCKDYLKSSGETLVPITLTASGELTKTTFSEGKVYWESTDKISLFSGENLSTKTELTVTNLYEDGRKAEFGGLAAAGPASYIAVYPSAEANTCNGTTLTVAIPSEQTAVAGGFMSGTNTAVATSVGNSLIFRNVGALVGIRLGAADAASTTCIKLKARKSGNEFAGISGTATVTPDETTGIPSVGEGSADYVTIAAPQGGFAPKTTYYAVVYPGDFAGFEVTLTQNGEEVVKSDDSVCNLERNSILTIGQKLVTGSDLPEEFTLTVDFTQGWPFVEEPATAFAAEGEEYTYSYKYDDAKAPMDITFVITTRGKGSYSYVAPSGDADGYLAMPTEAATTNRFGCISIPPIIDRYPKKVELIRNNWGYFVAFGGFPDFSGNTSSQNDPFEFPVTISNNDSWFPKGTVDSTPRDHCIGIRFSGTKVKSINITYTDTKPE